MLPGRHEPRGINHLASLAPVLLLCQGGARFECVEDGAGEQSLEAADRFAARLAFGLFAFEVGAGGGVVARLRDCDSVMSRVTKSGMRVSLSGSS